MQSRRREEPLSTGSQASWEALVLMPPLHKHHLEVDEGNISPIVPYIHLFYAYRLLGTPGTLETNPGVTEREAGTHPGQVTGP